MAVFLTTAGTPTASDHGRMWVRNTALAPVALPRPIRTGQMIFALAAAMRGIDQATSAVSSSSR